MCDFDGDHGHDGDDQGHGDQGHDHP
jgi:hypothetical protein